MTTRLPVAIIHEVREEDLDGFGFVAPLEILRWCEIARMEYLQRIGLPEWIAGERIGPVLSTNTFTFHRAVAHPDSVRVGARAIRVGVKSITFHHRIGSDSQKATVAEGTAVVFLFDYKRNKPLDIPAAIRRAIDDFERGSRASGRAIADRRAIPMLNASTPPFASTANSREQAFVQAEAPRAMVSSLLAEREKLLRELAKQDPDLLRHVGPRQGIGADVIEQMIQESGV